MIFSQLICEPYFFIRPYYHYNIQNISSTQDIVTQQQTKDQTYYNSNIYYVPQTPRNIRIKYYAFHLINTPNFHQLTLAKIPKEKEKQKTLPTFKSLNAQKFTGKKRRNNKNQQNQPKVYKIQIVIVIANSTQANCQVFSKIRMQILLIFQKKHTDRTIPANFQLLQKQSQTKIRYIIHIQFFKQTERFPLIFNYFKNKVKRKIRYITHLQFFKQIHQSVMIKTSRITFFNFRKKGSKFVEKTQNFVNFKKRQQIFYVLLL
eukprot:TRINITY_DN6822_c0_g1_i16.p2 TRINITY_DN6822_c0_g1~~TRINITY_DN6822_c0_g1_i16.p2  ORF type:complete len:261 (+),score=-25.25 TRINITY_DN6822_c0_g1_i16:940-1722(+)